MEFNSFKSRGFNNFGGVPAEGTIYDLWFDIVTRELFMSVRNPEQFLKAEADAVNFTNIFRTPVPLTVKKGLAINLPTVAPVGTIFLCTDTLRAFAGTGIGIQNFKLDVTRALRGSPISDF